MDSGSASSEGVDLLTSSDSCRVSNYDWFARKDSNLSHPIVCHLAMWGLRVEGNVEGHQEPSDGLSDGHDSMALATRKGKGMDSKGNECAV